VDLATSAASKTAARPGKAATRRVAVRLAISLTAGAVLIAAFLRLINISTVYQRLEHLRIGLALACGAAFLAAYVVRALRWRCLLRPCRVSIGRAAAIYQVAIFLNWLLPIRGGEIAMSLLLRRTDGIPVNRSLAAVSMDKAMDLLPAGLLLALVPLLGLQLSKPLWLLLGLTLALLAAAAAVLALAGWRRDHAIAMLVRPLSVLLGSHRRAQAGAFIAGFVDTLLALMRQPRLLVAAAGYTVVAIGLDAAFCLLAFRAVGVDVALPVVLYGYTFFNLAFILPSAPGQIGSNEIVGLLIFSGLLHVGRTGVAAMFLFSHPWTGLLMTGTGLLCLGSMGLTLRAAFRLARETEE
jgi:uncharacterized protein (TIRG00374 family)